MFLRLARKLKSLKARNMQFRKLLTDRTPEIEVMKDINRKDGECTDSSEANLLRDVILLLIKKDLTL